MLNFQSLNGGVSIATLGIAPAGGCGGGRPGKLSGRISISLKKRLLVIPTVPSICPADSGPRTAMSRFARTMIPSLRVKSTFLPFSVTSNLGFVPSVKSIPPAAPKEPPPANPFIWSIIMRSRRNNMFAAKLEIGGTVSVFAWNLSRFARMVPLKSGFLIVPFTETLAPAEPSITLMPGTSFRTNARLLLGQFRANCSGVFSGIVPVLMIWPRSSGILPVKRTGWMSGCSILLSIVSAFPAIRTEKSPFAADRLETLAVLIARAFAVS